MRYVDRFARFEDLVDSISASSLARPTCDTRNAWTPELFEEITDLMAEALFQDFQAHRRATVESPQGSNHRISLTKSPDKIK